MRKRDVSSFFTNVSWNINFKITSWYMQALRIYWLIASVEPHDLMTVFAFTQDITLRLMYQIKLNYFPYPMVVYYENCRLIFCLGQYKHKLVL